jgi:hypothetical protein
LGRRINTARCAFAARQPSRKRSLTVVPWLGDDKAMLILVRFAAWTVAAILVFVTLSPIEARPVIASPHLERAIAYALFGFLLATSYPRRWLLAMVGSVAMAGLLEIAQGLTVSRHGRMFDFSVKGTAAVLGVIAAHVLYTMLSRRTAR